MLWFGETWGAPVCEPADQVAVPVGKRCARCEETFEPSDQGISLPFFEAPGKKTSVGVPYHVSYHRMCLLACVVPLTIHRLREGLPVCRFSVEVPARWPPWHLWTDKPRQVTCEACRLRELG